MRDVIETLWSFFNHRPSFSVRTHGGCSRDATVALSILVIKLRALIPGFGGPAGPALPSSYVRRSHARPVDIGVQLKMIDGNELRSLLLTTATTTINGVRRCIWQNLFFHHLRAVSPASTAIS